jgi:hypothetical protein
MPAPEIERAVEALTSLWDGGSLYDNPQWDGLSPSLLSVLAWIIDEWEPGET